MAVDHFIDKHKGQVCFVLGTGPSLKDLSSYLLRDHIVIAVNGAIIKAPKSDYYFSCDYGMVLWRSWWELKFLECDLILASNTGFGAFQNKVEREVFEGIENDRINYAPRKKGLKIDKNPEMLSGSSSVHSAVHFAHLLGCSPIVLLGCDCRYGEGKKHYWDFPDQPKEGLVKPEYEQYRRPLAVEEPGAKMDGELHHHIKIWLQLKNQNPRIEIIDSSGGNLTMFPQMPLKEVLENYE